MDKYRSLIGGRSGKVGHLQPIDLLHEEAEKDLHNEVEWFKAHVSQLIKLFPNIKTSSIFLHSGC